MADAEDKAKAEKLAAAKKRVCVPKKPRFLQADRITPKDCADVVL